MPHIFKEFDLAHTNPTQSFQWRRSIKGLKRGSGGIVTSYRNEDEPEIEYQNLHPAYVS